MRNQRGVTVFELIFGMSSLFIFLVVALVVFGGGCNVVANVSGASEKKAKEEATSWAVGMGIQPSGVTCAGTDSDNDGYVSCNIAEKLANGTTQIHAVECGRALSFNSGCRTARFMPRQ